MKRSFSVLLMLLACGSHESPAPHQKARSSAPPQSSVPLPQDTTAAQIAEVKAMLDANDGGLSPLTPAMREATHHGLSPEPIRQVVMRHQGSLRHCYDVELAHVPDLNGGVTMTWMIAPDGSVSSASVAASTIKNTKVETCVLAEVKSWTFPTSDGPTHVAAYPFKFGMH